MSKATERLDDSAKTRTPEKLTSALSSEQSASQALLKLRAREHKVTRSRRQTQPGSQASRESRGKRAQQQLQQLKLKDAEDRYESQRQAGQQPAASEQRETRQVLSRLRELAQRQQDLNKQIQQLQSEMNGAEDDEQREELARRLKRLREQQQEILEDVDQLKDRLDQKEEQQQPAEEAARQLQETRENVRRASDALKRGQVSRAITEGTRAGRQLERMRDEFRRAASNQFGDAIREMQQQAESLDDRQQKIEKDFQELESKRQNSLRSTADRGSIEKNLTEQQQDLDHLLETMQQTVESAEETEPLLAEQLFDTLRQANRSQVRNALDVSRRAFQQSMDQEASQEATRARTGIQEIREGVDQAAQSVLGDDKKALRLALSEIDQASEQLARELSEQQAASNDGSSTPRDQNKQDKQRGSRSSDGKQPASGEKRPPGKGPGARDAPRGIRPLTGSDYLQWSDRLRDVEEMVNDPNLRSEAARVRGRARAVRIEFKRHGKEPNWDLVRSMIAQPLNELRDRIAQELMRRESKEAIVPIDRDPVPEPFRKQVDQYYQRLGTGK